MWYVCVCDKLLFDSGIHVDVVDDGIRPSYPKTTTGPIQLAWNQWVGYWYHGCWDDEIKHCFQNHQSHPQGALVNLCLMFLDIPRSKRKGVDWQQESEVHWVPWFNVQSNQLQNNSHFGLGSIHRGLVGDYWIYGLNKMIHGLQLHSGHSTHSH